MTGSPEHDLTTEVPEYLTDAPESAAPARDAARWVTDFLNVAYYRLPADEREVDDLRLAFSVLTMLHHLGLTVAAKARTP